MRLQISGGLMAAAIVFASPALAAPAGSVELKTSVLGEQRVAAKDGTTQVKLVPAARVTPGDRVIYRIAYRNTGTQAATGLVIANPVPNQMQFVGPADNAAVPEVSVDGKTFGPLSTLTVRANGAIRPAQPADVRVVRWRLSQPVAAGGEGQVAFRALLK